MRTISLDLRSRVIESYNEGISFGKIGERYKLPKGTVQRLIEHYRLTGTIEPSPPNSGRKPAFSSENLRKLEADVLAHPDATLAELLARSGVTVSIVSLHNTLKNKLGFVRKKRHYMRASRADLT